MSLPSGSRLRRRQFLGLGTASTAAVLLGTGAWTSSPSWSASRRSDNPFTLGVASGDPAPDSIVLWTRLAPEPFAPDGRGGMPRQPVRVQYQVAQDPEFRLVVRAGTVVATPALGHSAHPEVDGLEPDRRYWYRFRSGPHLSPVGRTRTMPDPRAAPRQLAFAFASCQAWHEGYYTAYDHMAEEDLDLVVHLGDYIYEYGLRRNKRGVKLPSQFNKEAYNLARYRLQYALYKSEPPLQRAHAAFPWLQTIDDHEVENDYAGDLSQPDSGADQDPAVFRRRRAAAFQAMYENMPLRRAQLPSGPDVLLHRQVAYGSLASFSMLDTRQYRSDQPCNGRVSSRCDDRFAPSQTMLGGRQKSWLLAGLQSSGARWQVLGNQAPMGQTDIAPGRDITRVYLDPWDGYAAERNELLAAARQRNVRNLVVVTGDRHAAYAQDLREDYADPNSAVVGTEFVGTSITSNGDGEDIGPEGRIVLRANPDLKFYNARRGYARVQITEQRWQTDFRVVPYISRPGAPIRTEASFVVEDGRPGVSRA